MYLDRKHNSQLRCGVSLYQGTNYEGPKPQMSAVGESFLGLYFHVMASLYFGSGGEFYENTDMLAWIVAFTCDQRLFCAEA
jgi:hypothetical protein